MSHLKKCPHCSRVLSEEDFDWKDKAKTQRCRHCKFCTALDRKYYKENKEKRAAKAKKYYANNKDKIRVQRAEYFKGYHKENRDKKIAYLKKYYKDNKKRLSVQQTEYRKNHKEDIRIYSKHYRKENKKRITVNKAAYFQKNKNKIHARIKLNYKEVLEQQRIQRQNPKIKLHRSISEGMRHSLKGNKNGRKWEGLVDYNLQQLMDHLEKLFQPGMTWKNYGNWHVEHKIPVSIFNFDNAKHFDFQRCWSLGNLRPMWASENFKKHASLDEQFQPSLKLGYC